MALFSLIRRVSLSCKSEDDTGYQNQHKCKLESEVMISERGVRMDLFVIKSGSILPNPYKGKNATSEPASTLFHTFKCSFKKVPCALSAYRAGKGRLFGIPVRDPKPRQGLPTVLPIN